MNDRAAPAANAYGSLAVYRRLLKYAAPHWPVFAVAVVGMVLFAAVDGAFIRLIQPFIDGSFVHRDPQVIRWVPWAILGLFVLRGVAAFLSAYGMAWVSQRVVMQMRMQVFDHILCLPVSHYDRVKNADLMIKVTYHANLIQDTATTVITAAIKDGLTLVLMIGVMVFMSWKLTLVALAVAPFVALSMGYVNKRFKIINKRIQGSMGGITHVADEAITGRRIVKVYGGEAYEARRFTEVVEFIRRQALKLVASSSGANGVVQLMAAISVSVIVYLAISGDMLRAGTPGTFAAFIGAMLAVRGPLNSLTGINERLSRGLVAATDLFGFLDTPKEADTGTRPLARATGAVRFAGVHFRYPGAARDALSGVSVEVKPGETVAFVGKSGSGKSTLLSLLPRFHDAGGGQVLLDGHDVREYRLRDLRRQIALVDQNVVLFNGSVAQNIAYALDPRPEPARIIEAARAANAWEFIERLPGQLDAPLGQNGVMLSGGQRQRIAIARALLRNAPILILDEATSALDTESERDIQQAIERLVKGRTTLVIAHRLSTIQRADRIVVMQEGAVAEEGRHEQLLAQNGLYAALHRMQFEDAAA